MTTAETADTSHERRNRGLSLIRISTGDDGVDNGNFDSGDNEGSIGGRSRSKSMSSGTSLGGQQPLLNSLSILLSSSVSTQRRFGAARTWDDRPCPCSKSKLRCRRQWIRLLSVGYSPLHRPFIGRRFSDLTTAAAAAPAHVLLLQGSPFLPTLSSVAVVCIMSTTCVDLCRVQKKRLRRQGFRKVSLFSLVPLLFARLF